MCSAAALRGSACRPTPALNSGLQRQNGFAALRSGSAPSPKLRHSPTASQSFGERLSGRPSDTAADAQSARRIPFPRSHASPKCMARGSDFRDDQIGGLTAVTGPRSRPTSDWSDVPFSHGRCRDAPARLSRARDPFHRRSVRAPGGHCRVRRIPFTGVPYVRQRAI